MDETDEGLTYQQYEQYRTVSEQIDSESDGDTQSVKIEEIGPEEGIDGIDSKGTQSNDQDDGSWILDLIDLSGLKDWPEKLQQDVKEMLKEMQKYSPRMIWIWEELI